MSSSRAVVLVPCGPGPSDEHVDDTLASIRDHLGADHTLMIVDDTGRRERRWPDGAVVVPAGPFATGTRGGLFRKLSVAFQRARSLGEWDVLLRLDTDALVLRGGTVEAAAERFRRSPDVGLLGSLSIGADGGSRSFSSAAAALRWESGWFGWRKPKVRRALRRALAAAGPDWPAGEHVLGAAYALSRPCVDELAQRGWLTCEVLDRSEVADDHLLSLAVAACGFRLGEFGRPGDPLAVKWIGLPSSPASVWASGASITHSVKSWEGGGRSLDETEIRAEFRALRASSSA